MINPRTTHCDICGKEKPLDGRRSCYEGEKMESDMVCSYCGGHMIWDKENKIWMCLDCGGIVNE